MRKILIGLTVATSALFLTACGDDDSRTVTTKQPVVIEETQKTPATVEKEVEVDENVVKEGDTSTTTTVTPVAPATTQ